MPCAAPAYGGDRDSLTLHPEDEQLIQAVAEANPRTIVAIRAGTAVVTEAWRDKVAGILMLWYPGQEGGHAFADVLLGRVNPSGKLPCTFPKSADDLPFFDKDAIAITYDLWHGYRKLERDGAEPAFPFGFGLSYTTFGMDNLRVSDVVHPDGAVVATVDVTNTGDVTGAEVVQLYVGARSSAVERALSELKAFTKIELHPGQTRTIRLAVPATALAYFDTANGWTVEPGDYEVIVGRHSLDEEALRKQVTIKQSTP
jgi:beta-glucosidase